LIAPPVYTRPSKYKNLKVPEILLSGDPKKVKEWREKKSDEKTKVIKP
jgi:tRNA-(guanine-N1)-methyltransferase